jgi:DMSO/TMAO reductase YedYZ molybdopterin-dependent catalytic subunit
MEKEKRVTRMAVLDRRRILPWIVFLLGLLLALLGRMAWAETTTTQEVEIREYEGEKLGSARDFRENSIQGTQRIEPEAYRLVVDGLVANPAAFTYAELAAQTHTAKVATLHCVEGWSVKILWEGISLSALFDEVQPSPEATTVIFHAQDGYTTSLSLHFVVSRNLILADRMDGLTLSPERGFPFQLVAEDKWGYKWIKWVTRVELSSDSSYHGYWESRGYSNVGDLSKSRFGP